MDVTINIDSVKKTLSIQRTETGYSVSIEGRTYDITDVSAAEGTLAFLAGHISHIAHVSNGEGHTRLSLGGHNYSVIEEDRDADRPGGAGAGAGDGTLTAPMPGNIVAVHVSEGDTVTVGQAMIVLESMKMQNEISSSVDGVVKKINCGAGEQVGFGDVLAIVEAAE